MPPSMYAHLNPWTNPLCVYTHAHLKKNNKNCQSWYSMPLIPEFGSQKQEDL